MRRDPSCTDTEDQSARRALGWGGCMAGIRSSAAACLSRALALPHNSLPSMHRESTVLAVHTMTMPQMPHLRNVIVRRQTARMHREKTGSMR